jgi:hypothetical protein
MRRSTGRHGALAVLVIVVAVAKLVRRAVRRSLERTRLDPTVHAPFWEAWSTT